MIRFARCAALSVFLLASIARAAETQTQYLSGLGKDDPVKWQFKCDKGQNANAWSTIGVPSNWELQGYGIYTYGRVPPAGGWPRVHGVYKRSFTTPRTWKEKAIFVNFEGVMTDTRVTINGQLAGPIHQGGYYAFKYDITDLLKPAGQPNEIQVDVDDDSMNDSVNHAERRGDFWNYGGIFRPVYLEAVPKTFIDHLAVNAAASGSLDVEAKLSDLRSAAPAGTTASLEMQVLDLTGKPVGMPVTASEVVFGQATHLTTKIAHPRLWTAETPDLYQLEVRLKVGGVVVHTVHQRFGFRTIEVRPGEGIFVNGSRVVLKGFARHSFWPDSGRTLSEQISKDDINLMKEMNANAVRSSHYPPDRHFLDACDELGLYVLDELTGWQAKYDTDIGKKLVKEMVEHDVNHPSILFWDNGTKGDGT
jgi:beta-galactosidase/beta-glucuronidase